MATVTEDAADPLLYRLPDFPSGIPISPSPVMTPCNSDGIAALISISGVAFPALVVGGEPRIPVHLLLSRVLANQRASEVQALMDDLNIHKSLANSEQTERLRNLDVEALNTPDCSNMNLMARSDAERICGILRIESDRTSTNESVVEESERLSVEHNMFGTVKGWVYPSRKGGRSVRCQNCRCFFTPEDFVAHSHNENKEYRRTVHWGFDPSNWRMMLELVKPSSEHDINRIRWKQFIDEPIEASCCREGFEIYSTNKCKRSMVDNSVELPVKAARFMDMPEIPIECLTVGPAVSDNTSLSKPPFSDNSFPSISEHTSIPGISHLLPISLQFVAGVSNPSPFKLVDDTMLPLKSSYEKLECLELALKQSSAVDPVLANALREIRASLVEYTMAESGRLQTVCDSLFAMFQQSSVPMNTDSGTSYPLSAGLGNIHANQIALAITNSNGCSGACVSNDLLQQHMKFVQIDQLGAVSKSMIGDLELPLTGFTTPSDPQILQYILMQQIMQFLSPSQQTRVGDSGSGTFL